MESTHQCEGGAECVVEPDTQARPVRDIIKEKHISKENVNKYQPNKRQQYQQYRQRNKQPAAIVTSESNKQQENILYGITCTILLFILSLVNYAKNKHKRRQREMEESSNQLEMVRQRNLLANSDMKVAVDEPHDSPRDARAPPQSPTAKLVSNIRVKQQQNKLSTSTKLSRQKKTKKKQTLKKYLDMNHKAADEALERRQRVIAAEQTLVQPRRRVIQQHQQQQQRNDIEEAERVALVQQQNADYEEALMLDQERAQKLSLKKEIRLKRKHAIQDAEQRLTTAGIQSTNNQNNNIASGESSVRVRLLMPSGRKVDGVFAATQELGLLYDLALLVLDKENLLYSDEDDEGDFNYDTTDTDDDDQSEGLLSPICEKDYTVISNLGRIYSSTSQL